MTWILRALLPIAALVVWAGMVCAAPVVAVNSDEDGQTSATWHGSQVPLVVEIGQRGLPWRWIDVTVSSGRVHWSAKKDRSYLVGAADDYARHQLVTMRRAVGHDLPPVRNLEAEVAAALRWTQRQAESEPRAYAESQMRLSSALAALLGVRVGIECGVDNKVWPEQWLPLSASLKSARGVRARFAGFQIPDNWQMDRTVAQSAWRPAFPAAQRTAVQVRLPAISSFYRGDYPLMATYELDYKGLRFRVVGGSEAQLTHPIETKGSIRTISDTAIDFTVQVKSLLPMPGVRTELSLPAGWSGSGFEGTFDLKGSRDLTYRIAKPAGENGLRIVGAIFRIGDYGTSKRLITDHEVELGERVSVTGLSMVQPDGSASERAEVQGRICRLAPTSGRMLFNASDNFFPGEATFVTVAAAADTPATVSISYQTVPGKDVVTAAQAVKASEGWRDLVFVLRDARFDGSYADGADFGILLKGDRVGVSRVRISRFGAL